MIKLDFTINELTILLKGKRYYNQNKTIFFEDIIQYVSNKNLTLTFNNFALNYIQNPKEKFELATITKYKSFLKHLNNFKKEIYFNDITPELVINFKEYLEVSLKLKGNATKSYFDKFKKIVNQAEREAFLDFTQTRFLFTDAKIKLNKPKRTYLEIEEIKKTQQFKIPRK